MKISKTQNHGNVRWCVHFMIAGKSARRFFARESDAKALAGQYQDSAGMLRELASLPHASVADALASLQIADAGNFKLMDAALHYQQHRPLAGMNTEAAVDAFLDFYKGENVSRRQRSSVEGVVRAFRDLHGDLALGEITPELVSEFARQGEVAPATQLNRKARLGRFLNWCVAAGTLKSNPCKTARVDKATGKKISWHTPEQAARLLATAAAHHPSLVPFVALGYFCGLRVGEIIGSADAIGVEWNNVFLDRPQPELEVPTGAGKTRLRRMVPIPPNAAEWLGRGGDLHPIKNFRKRINALRADAGLGDLGRWEWDGNIQRHTFATMHVAHHQRPDWTKYLMGHEEKSHVFRRHYDGRVSPAEAEGFWGIVPGVN